MKILIDECVPRDLKYHLESQGRECLTVQEMGYSGKKNGELLALAENNFDVFLTLDKNVQYQQNLTNRNIAILLVGAKSNDMDDILPYLPACFVALATIKAGQVVRVGWTRPARGHPRT